MAENMVEHRASITVDAPVHQVYSLFSHFNDFPKFMSFVKEVTYYDDQRSHWVAEVSGQHEWDAVNEDWIPDHQIGWRSVSGLNNYGRVLFQPVSAQQTHIDVSVNYHPPAGFLGTIGEHMGIGKHFDDVLQKDLNHFAEMVNQAPANALDPTSSNYLFHEESAVAKGTTTERQEATMRDELAAAGGATGAAAYAGTEAGQPSYTGQGASATREDAPVDRPIMDRDIVSEPSSAASQGSQQAGMMEPGRTLPEEQIGAQAGAMGTPDINPVRPQINPLAPPTTRGENAPNLPPEQIPRWDLPEGDQPQR